MYVATAYAMWRKIIIEQERVVVSLTVHEKIENLVARKPGVTRRQMKATIKCSTAAISKECRRMVDEKRLKEDASAIPFKYFPGRKSRAA
jgi:hypothetical protein